MTNATPTKNRRVRSGATSPKGPAKALKATTESKPIYSTERLRAIAVEHFKPQDVVELSFVEQIAKAMSLIQKFTFAFPLDSLLDEYFAGVRKLSSAEVTAALRESANRDRIIDEGYKLISRASRDLIEYRGASLNSRSGPVELLNYIN